jgi:hypothetical protein
MERLLKICKNLIDFSANDLIVSWLFSHKIRDLGEVIGPSEKEHVFVHVLVRLRYCVTAKFWVFETKGRA